MRKHITTLAKAQISAFIGGLVDYAAMIVFTEYGHIFYSYSIILSGFVGAVVNFYINRKWTFTATQQQKRTQIPKFILMVVGSVLLKSGGTTLLTEFGHLDYKISKPIVDIFVSLGFNFTLQRFWVFKK